VISGRNGTVSSAASEIVHIVKYDKFWSKIASTGITGFTDTMVFDGQPVRVLDLGGHLIFRTATYQGGHNVSLEIVLNKETMKVTGDTRTGTLDATGFTSHCFDSHIASDGNDVVTVEVTDGECSGAVMTRRTFDPEVGNYTNANGSGYVLEGNGTYDGYGNCCGISVGGFEISENKYIVVGTTIDQKNIETSRTRNVFLSVAERDTDKTFQEKEPTDDGSKFADIKMLTSYKEGTEIANTPHLV